MLPANGFHDADDRIHLNAVKQPVKGCLQEFDLQGLILLYRVSGTNVAIATEL
jgi:hypothetical protein